MSKKVLPPKTRTRGLLPAFTQVSAECHLLQRDHTTSETAARSYPFLSSDDDSYH